MILHETRVCGEKQIHAWKCWSKNILIMCLCIFNVWANKSQGVWLDDLWSARPAALHNCGMQYSCGQRGKNTYRHHQLKGMLVHPHRWLVLLHHDGDYSNTNNLRKRKDKLWNHSRHWWKTKEAEIQELCFIPSVHRHHNGMPSGETTQSQPHLPQQLSL